MEIQQTEDYNNFEFINGNRTVSMVKVRKIIKDVEGGLNLFPYCPVIVNKTDAGKLLIIDGQHRFTASQKLEFPIYYIIAHNIPLRDIARMNNNTDKWKNRDFLDCYIRLGNSHYMELKAFMEKYKVPLRMSCSMLHRNAIHGGGQDLVRFKDGNFECIYLEETKTLIGLVDYLFGEYTFNRSRNLLEAVKHLKDVSKWDVETMADKIKKNRHAVQEQSSKKTWLFHLNQIYNIRNQKIQHII